MLKVQQFLEAQDISLCLSELGGMERDGLFNRYNNPFESKAFLQDKTNLPPNIAHAYSLIRNGSTQWWLSKLLSLPISTCDFNHYGGLFIYTDGDYLKPHVDAGIHPKVRSWRKVATALLYLTSAELEFYTGDSCVKEDPLLWSRSLHTCKPGELVVFTNTDTAWHGVPTVHGDRRIVLTVSYLAFDDFKHHQYTNPRTRAYFARTVWEPNTPELQVLRLARASEEHHEEVYRMETGVDR